MLLMLGSRNILRHRGRTAMTLAAMVFGVVGLILSGGFVYDLYDQLGEALIHSQSGHLQVSRAGFQEFGSRSPERYLIEAPEPLRLKISQKPEVADVMARISFSGLVSNGNTDWPIVGEGVEPEREAALGSQLHITAGRQLAPSDAYGILLGEGVAKALKFRPGERLTLLLNTAEGALNSLEFEVVGTFQSLSADFDARAVRIPLAAAHELLGSRGANTLVISLRRTADTERVAAALKAELDAGLFEVKTWVELNDFYTSTVATFERQFGVLQLIILVLVLLSVANSVNMSAFERVGEFGTMMALGNRRGHLFRLLVVENCLLGIIGGTLGVVLGILLAYSISAIGIPMPPPPNANIGYLAHVRVVPSVIATAFLIGSCAAVLASLWPAWRVSHVPVDQALRQNY